MSMDPKDKPERIYVNIVKVSYRQEYNITRNSLKENGVAYTDEYFLCLITEKYVVQCLAM